MLSSLRLLASSLPVDGFYNTFRKTAKGFFETHVAPFHVKWSQEQLVDRALFKHAGALGLFSSSAAYGDSDAQVDFIYNVIRIEEQAYSGFTGPGFTVHADIVIPYFAKYGTEESKAEWLPKLLDGSAIGAIAMTEPSAGSDLKAMKTAATRTESGFRLSGSKTFISNGVNADVVIVAARDVEVGGLSLFTVDTSSHGFSRGKQLRKIGLHAQDTCELFFDDISIRRSDVIGPRGGGLKCLMQELPQERLCIAISAVAAAEATLCMTAEYIKSRSAFGAALSENSVVRSRIAQLAMDTSMCRSLVEACVHEHVKGSLDAVGAAAAKVKATELEWAVADGCLQLHGGYGCGDVL